MAGVSKLRHRHVYDIDDIGRMLFGRVGYEVSGGAYCLFACQAHLYPNPRIKASYRQHYYLLGYTDQVHLYRVPGALLATSLTFQPMCCMWLTYGSIVGNTDLFKANGDTRPCSCANNSNSTLTI
ncbi:hypothetical protein FZEAL_6692 [Fusarium zealandicum]|uniref:Uncharacterized protein n=1 Tax=Fusarium zealandicum TaxID=1053134 RepID=A0A8H4XIJ8_9HYPO|nr:hypothetical protein FZEAL_6692 [Fusarium zealandicum]